MLFSFCLRTIKKTNCELIVNFLRDFNEILSISKNISKIYSYREWSKQEFFIQEKVSLRENLSSKNDLLTMSTFSFAIDRLLKSKAAHTEVDMEAVMEVDTVAVDTVIVVVVKKKSYVPNES